MGTFYRRHGSHSSGAVILVDFSRVFLPNKHMLLADAKKMLDVTLPDDMPPLEGNPFEVVIHFGNIMAQRHANRLLHFDFFHFFPLFL